MTRLIAIERDLLPVRENLENGAVWGEVQVRGVSEKAGVLST